MVYIILAAGIGSRLYPYTKNTPKCLMKVSAEETVIQRAVRLIHNNDADAKIYVALGFCEKQVRTVLGENCKYVYNPFYSVTNSIASLWFVEREMGEKESVVIINGDIVFSDAFAKEITSEPKAPLVYFDSSIRTHGDYNVQTLCNMVVAMGKELTTYDGEYVGITKIPASHFGRFMQEINTMVNDGLFDQWYENALVQMSLNESMEIEARDATDYDWSEIDSIDNLLKVRTIIAKETKSNG